MKKNKQLYYWAFTAIAIALIAITWQWLQYKNAQHGLLNNKSNTHIASQTQDTLKTEQNSSAHSTLTNTTTLKTNTRAQEQQLNEKIAALIQKRLTPEMIDEINQKLNPGNQTYAEVITNYGAYIDLRGRASTVSIALIDDNGELIVTDISNPIPINNSNTAKQTTASEALEQNQATYHAPNKNLK